MPDPSSSRPAPAPAHAAVSPEERHPHSLVVRIWPNIPILYPMALAALVCGILSMFFSFDGAISRLAEAPVAVAQTAAVEGGDAAAGRQRRHAGGEDGVLALGAQQRLDHRRLSQDRSAWPSSAAPLARPRSKLIMPKPLSRGHAGSVKGH